MPRKITAYACKYKCGQRINSKKESIEQHEKICFSNPSRRACKTCNNFDFDEDGSYCKLDEGGGPEYIPAGKYATHGCGNWELKGD